MEDVHGKIEHSLPIPPLTEKINGVKTLLLIFMFSQNVIRT